MVVLDKNCRAKSFCQGQNEEETDFVDKLISARVGNHCDSNGLGSLCATAQSQGSLEVSD